MPGGHKVEEPNLPESIRPGFPLSEITRSRIAEGEDLEQEYVTTRLPQLLKILNLENNRVVRWLFGLDSD